MDTHSEWGKRNIPLTMNPRLLEGFSLNRRYLFDSIVRTPVSGTIQNEEVVVDLPALIPEINFMIPGNYSWYRFIAVAGLVPDLYFKENGYGYLPKGERDYSSDYVQSDWLPVNNPVPAFKLAIKRQQAIKSETCSMMVAVGIAFGQMQGNTIDSVKYVGGAKVLMME